MTSISSVNQTAVTNRVKRAQGQLAGVLKMMEEERDVAAVLHQLKAVSRALDRAGFAMVAQEWRASAVEGADLSDERVSSLEKLFLTLA